MDNRPWKRPLDEVSSNEPAAKKAATADIFSMMMFGGLGGGMKGMRSLRGEQGKMTRQFNKLAAEDWARRASERPYALSDLAVPEKSAAAYAFFDGLSLAETKHECAAQDQAPGPHVRSCSTNGALARQGESQTSREPN